MKIGFVSLGCPKALVDTERLMTQLRAEGYLLVSDYKAANLIVINTCGFIEDAVTESMEAIAEAMGENGRVIVTGCLGAREEAVLAKFPAILGVTGPGEPEKVLDLVHQHMPISDAQQCDPARTPVDIKLTPPHYAYIKISEGCNHHCTFCIIPEFRGRLVSRPIGEVLFEAERLVGSGVKELLVVAQDTAAYGLDRDYASASWQGRPIETRIFDLANALGTLGVWVRLHYLYPYPHVDALIPLMADGKLLPYLDIPFQHVAPRVLRAMQRPAAQEQMVRRIEAWRAICPDITIRSTFLVGFPGETEAEFALLLSFLQEVQLDRVGCFKFSAVEGLSANALPNPIPELVKEERYERLMALQTKISADKLKNKVGLVLPVLIDELTETTAVGRTQGDAPEVDGRVVMPRTNTLSAGDLVKARIERSDEYDLYGVVAL